MPSYKAKRGHWCAVVVKAHDAVEEHIALRRIVKAKQDGTITHVCFNSHWPCKANAGNEVKGRNSSAFVKQCFTITKYQDREELAELAGDEWPDTDTARAAIIKLCGEPVGRHVERGAS